MYHHTIKAALDGSGSVSAWQQHVGQSILSGTPFEKMMVKDGIDARSRRVIAPVCHSQSSVEPFAEDRRAGTVVALQSLDPPLSRPKRSLTSADAAADPVVFQCSAGRQAPPSRGAAIRSGQSRLGLAWLRARPAKSADAASPCTSRSTPLSRKSPK
jgi:hypothetical protein